MTKKAEPTRPLIERLRTSNSTAKTRFIAQWPEIKEALDAGHSAKAIHAELSKGDGLAISYRRFCELVKELNEPKPAATTKTAQPNSTGRTSKTKDAKNTDEKPSSDTQVTEIKRYEHNPVPNLDELV
ncbi:MAG TPA: TraK family protein [Denitromonas sp.]|nr:hypothetical protein [Gammaproteobacteria bacterium]HPR08455.1 TraK family protein [Denitromonas sp.]